MCTEAAWPQSPNSSPLEGVTMMSLGETERPTPGRKVGSEGIAPPASPPLPPLPLFLSPFPRSSPGGRPDGPAAPRRRQAAGSGSRTFPGGEGAAGAGARAGSPCARARAPARARRAGPAGGVLGPLHVLRARGWDGGGVGGSHRLIISEPPKRENLKFTCSGSFERSSGGGGSPHRLREKRDRGPWSPREA